MKKYIYPFLFVLMGFFALSPFSSWLLMKKMGFDLALPELFFVPFVIILRKEFNVKRVYRLQSLYLYIVLWISLIAIALLWGDFSLYEILGASRAYLYIGLCYIIFKKGNPLSIINVMYISFGSLLGWAITSYMNLQLSVMLTDKLIVTYGAMLAIPLFIILSLSEKKYFLFCIGMAVIIFTSFTAGLRRQMLIVALSLCFYFLFSIIVSKRKNISVFLILLPIMLVMLLMPYFEDYLSTNSPVLYNRVFVRTEILLSDQGFKTEGEETRLNNFKFYFDNIEQFQIPKGFVSKSTSSEVDYVGSVGRFNDFPLLELTSIFGTLPFFFIFLYFSKFAIKNFSLYLRYQHSENMLFFSTFIIMVVLLFLEGTFINFAYSVPFTGYCLGRLKYYSIHQNVLVDNERKHSNKGS